MTCFVVAADRLLMSLWTSKALQRTSLKQAVAFTRPVITDGRGTDFICGLAEFQYKTLKVSNTVELSYPAPSDDLREEVVVCSDGLEGSVRIRVL